MGLLITLYLISTNVYGSTEAPPNRGFSNIELWITGTQICILLAILEYSIILALKRINNISLLNEFTNTLNIEEFAKKMDGFSLTLCFTFFFFFNLIYWIKSTTATWRWNDAFSSEFTFTYFSIISIHWFNIQHKYTYVSREHSRMLLLYFTVILATLTRGWNFFPPQF